MSRTSAPTRTTRCPRLWRPGYAPTLECRCCAREQCSAPLVSRGNECSHTPIGRSSWCAPLPTRPSLRWRTRGCLVSCRPARATSKSRSNTDVQPVLDTVVDTAARLCAPDSATIYIREGQVYRAVASSTRTADPEYWARVRGRTLVPGRGSMTGRVALEGRVVQIPDILADPDFAVAETVRTGRRTLLGVPLLRDSEPIGVINLARKRVEPFTERQIELVRTFADQAVIAIENARLLTELQARTDELTRSVAELQALEEVLR